MDNEILISAINYKNNGWSIIPVPEKTKIPVISAWQNRKPEDCAPEREFSSPSNIGVILGENSGGLIDIDLDCSEAIALAPRFLPETGIVFGRDSKPNSHYIYKVMDKVRTKRFQFLQNGTLTRPL